MAELTKLLGFMSSWDRQAVLAEYAAKFENCTDFDALVESIGTPTRVAIGLARDYVPSPPPAAPAAAEPAAGAEDALPAEAAPEAAETVSAAAELPEPAPAPAPAKKKAPVSGGGVVLCVILGLLVALPVTIIALCIGLPFLAGGIGAITAVVSFALRTFPVLGLISDILLIGGGTLAVSALGLLLAALGLWLSLTLAALWLEKVVLPVGMRLCRKKEARSI